MYLSRRTSITLRSLGLHCNGQLVSTWLNYAMHGSNESQKKKVHSSQSLTTLCQSFSALFSSPCIPVFVLLIVHPQSQPLRSPPDNWCTIPEPCSEQHICVCERALFERDDDELGAFEASAEKLADVLCMWKVYGNVYFVENVHWSGIKLEEGHDGGECYQGPVW